MKGLLKRILAVTMVACMVMAFVPSNIISINAETVTTTPGNTSLDVEYFTSTLYNWDEGAANVATLEADKADSSTVSYTTTSVSYNNRNDSTYTSGSYYVLVNGEYYVVTNISCTGSGSKGNYTYSWTITYDGGSTTSSNSSITLYYQDSSTSYEGKGFYFTDNTSLGTAGLSRTNSLVPAYSTWTGGNDSDGVAIQNYLIYSGLAASKLSESNNAPFSNDINAAPLFATDGTNEEYTSVYTNVQVPFYIDEDGYYNLNSDTNAVYFENGTGSDNATMLIADKPATYYWSGTGYVTGFAPFNSLNSSTQNALMSGSSSSSSNYTTSYTINESSMTYGFGMVTSVDFQMTDDGKDANGNDITFTFSGDDDVWVYIDGVLVLDIGGTHDAITGTINFVDGSVTLTSGYGKVGDMAVTGVLSTTTTSSSLSQTNLYTVLNTTLTGFAAAGSHTMTIYYMDRGQGRTNCQIRFNLPQKDSVSVTKTIDEYYTSSEYEISDDVMKTLNNIDFTFTLYKGEDVVANKSYSLYDSDGNLVGTGSTDAAGTFTIKNGQTATFKNISLDEESSYHVVETSPGDRWTAKWTATSNVSKATISGGSGLTSDTVTVTGSSTAADTITFVCENSYSYGSVQPDVDVNDDTIVLDYGLPVEVDVLANDNVTAYGVAVDSTMTLVGADENGKVTGTYGYAEIKNGKIVYTLTEDFCGIETIQYTVSASATNTETGEEETQSGTATLTVIPATSVYYEEDFNATFTTTPTTVTKTETDNEGNETTTDEILNCVNNGSWNSNLISIATTNATFSVENDGDTYDLYQETGFVGTTNDSTYGTDKVYLSNLGDSYGTSLKVDTTNGAAQYTYSFTGTGTTIYGRVSDTTGYVRVTVKDSTGETVDTQYIDTINLITYTDDETEQILDTELYNIPIYQDTNLESGYDTYTVQIYVYKAGTLHDDNCEFYLDGVRVHNPMGTSTNDNENYSTAASAYATDGEANIAVVNIREKIYADYEDNYANDVFTLTDIDGNIVDVDVYNYTGPNQEFYLEADYNVTFALVNWSSQSYKIYLGLKAPAGVEAEVTVGSSTISIGNSSDCYYDISSYVTVATEDLDEDGTEETIGYVEITSVSGLVALTNLKVTGVDEFDLAYEVNVPAPNEAYYYNTTDSDTTVDNEEDVTSEATATLYLTSTAFVASLGEEEEESVFTPESVSASCSYASRTKKATVTVLTSKDVSYVTINGVKATQKNASGKYRFTASYTKVASGTNYEIICYDADGVASEVYTVTAK